ncbi:MAG TPA: MarR family transcriptional regulator [Candidatus Sulfotelmatobacter sp.]|jgi:DNA-binding MarR family transcriptional regulator|nr:MarR family transcriptional regulator [Candidatus Sulfotelmatobacter sp.]
MASTSTLRKSNNGSHRGSHVVLDLETRAKKGDHQALRLWLRLLSCTVRIENKIRLRLRREFNMTLPRFDLMAQLERSSDGLRMNEISRRLMVSGGNVTGITDQLEREGLVARTPCPGDRRAFTVKLTDTGLKRFREMAARHELWIIELLSGLSRDEKEAMIHELGKVKTHINSGAFMAHKPNQRSQAGETR